MSLRPSQRLVGLLALLFVLTLLAPWVPSLEVLILGASVCLALASIADAALPAWRRPPQVERILPRRWPVGRSQTVTLRIAAAEARLAFIEVIDDVPQIGPTQNLHASFTLPDEGWIEHRYSLQPETRGTARFGLAEALLQSPLGLWQLRKSCGEADEIQVVPDHGPALRRTLETLAYRVSPSGTRRRPMRGQGTSFHQLREYRDGDLPQQIDWKATAKRRQIISREYEQERDQRILIALDRGRRMRAYDHGRTMFDRALDASLVLSYLALRQGDTVGMLGFSGPIDALPAVKGPKALSQLLQHVQSWQPGDAPSDFAEAARNVLTHEPRRTLLVLITNLRGEDVDELVRAIHSLRSRHLVVVASLGEAVVHEQLRLPANDFDSARISSAAALVLENRRRAIDAVTQAGAWIVDSTATALPETLARTYLDAKRIGAL